MYCTNELQVFEVPGPGGSGVRGLGFEGLGFRGVCLWQFRPYLLGVLYTSNPDPWEDPKIGSPALTLRLPKSLPPWRPQCPNGNVKV